MRQILRDSEEFGVNGHEVLSAYWKARHPEMDKR
jgi:hypothetical protein